MYLWELARIVLRRWYVVVTFLLLIPLALAWVIGNVPTQYQASGQLLLLLPSQATGEKTPSNPYLNLPPGLTTTASLIASEAMRGDVGAELTGGRPTAEYSVGLVPGVGPLMSITTKDVDPAEAIALRDRVAEWLRARLVTIQNAVGVPENLMMRADQVNFEGSAEPLSGSRLRALAGVMAGGLVLVLLASVIVDRLLTRRRLVTGPASELKALSAPTEGLRQDQVAPHEHPPSDRMSSIARDSPAQPERPRVVVNFHSREPLARPSRNARAASASTRQPSVKESAKSRIRTKRR